MKQAVIHDFIFSSLKVRGPDANSLNGSGIRDTARALNIGLTTTIGMLKNPQLKSVNEARLLERVGK